MNSNINLYQALDTVNQWIHNCDTKTSTILGFIGVTLSIFVSSQLPNKIYLIAKACSNATFTISNFTYMLFVILPAVLMIVSLYYFVSVLVPRINLKHKSVMFFGNISSYESFHDYLADAKSTTDDEADEDLLHQIYAASKICAHKFKSFKLGLLCFVCAVCLFFLWFAIGYIVFM